MGLFSRFENKAEDVIEGSAGSGRGGIEPVKLAKRAAKEMEREKMVGVGHEYAPTLYNILVSETDDERMNGYYPSLAGEIETYLTSHAAKNGLVLDCPPLVRFIVDEGLKRGKFDIIAESVSPAIIEELRHEEMIHYGLERPDQQDYGFEEPAPARPYAEPAPIYTDPVPDQAREPHEVYEQHNPVPEEPVSAAPQARAYPPVEPAPAPEQPAAQARPQAQPQPSTERTVMINDVIPQQPLAVLFDYNTQQTFPIVGDRTTIGRETSCNVVISDPSVSRHHAEILRSEAGWLIRDTGSTNGTLLNGATTTQSRIYDGDIIELGKTQLEFQED